MAKPLIIVQPSTFERLPYARGRPLIAYGAAIGAVLLALALRLAIAPLVHDGFPFITLFPAVILSAFLLGRGPGLLATALSGWAAAHELPAVGRRTQ